MLAKFKRFLSAFFIGSEDGVFQWHYTLTIAILLFITWRFYPEIALAQTILWAIHFVLIYIICAFVRRFEFCSSRENAQRYITIYKTIFLICNVVLLTFSFFVHWFYTIVALEMVVGTMLATLDLIGDKGVHLYNAILIALFIITALFLPISLIWRIGIIFIFFFLIHPIVEVLGQECFCIDYLIQM